ncbi:MAG: zinc ribbon domain-containing protein [Clostridia bacterium]|nr:zinc ribbon domain-containing protein [Clostridia bacterium]
MSKYCIKCGKELKESDMFCIACGTKQETSVPPAAPFTSPSPQTETLTYPGTMGTTPPTYPKAPHYPVKTKRSKKPLIFIIGAIAVIGIAAVLLIMFLNRPKGLMDLDEVEEKLNEAYIQVWDGYEDDYEGVKNFKIEDVDDENYDQAFSCDIVRAEDSIMGLIAIGHAKDGKLIELHVMCMAFEDDFDKLSDYEKIAYEVIVDFPVTIFEEDIKIFSDLMTFHDEMDTVDDYGGYKKKTVIGDIEYTYSGGVGYGLALSEFNIRYLPEFEEGYFEELYGSDDDSSTESDASNIAEADWNVVYADKIDEYRQAMTMDADSFNEKYDYGSDNSSINAFITNYIRYSGSIGYSFYDIDANGTSELIFADMTSDNIIDIYTTHDGKTIKLFEDCYFGERSRVHVLNDGRILNEGSNSAASSSCDMYILDGVIGEVVLTESYYCDGWNGPDPYMTEHTYMDENEYYKMVADWLALSAYNNFSWTTIEATPKPADITQSTAPVTTHTHSYSSWSDDKNGYTHSKSCSCGDDKTDIHTFGSGKITKQPTETETGTEIFTCVECGASKTETLAVLNHTHDYTTWWADDRNGYTHTRFCICGDEDTEAHTFDQGKITKQPTETETGIKTYTCSECSAEKTETIAKLDHTHRYGSWSDNRDNSTHSRSCSCGDKETKAHSFDSGKVTKQPTTTATGIKTYTCPECGAEKTETIAKLEAAEHTHSYGSWMDNGEYNHTRTCSCGETETESHSFNYGTITKQPTTNSTGIMTYNCLVCDATETEIIPKLEASEHTHSYSDWFDNDNETTHSRSCSCGDFQSEEHTYDAGTVLQEPTTTEYGYIEYTCTKCNAYKVDLIDPPMQNYDYSCICNYCGHNDGIMNLLLEKGVKTDVIWDCSSCGQQNWNYITWNGST